MSASFKITFNKPAFRTFFQGDGVTGIRVRIIDNRVLFRPVLTPTGEDIVPIAERTRGGVEITINGDQADHVLRLLQPKIETPFYLLRRTEKNWIEVVKYTGKGHEPPKYEPHARIWLKDMRCEAPCAEAADFDFHMNEVRKAKNIVDKYVEERRTGRPPREVIEAKMLLNTFAETAREVLPLADLYQCYEILGNFLGISERNHLSVCHTAGMVIGHHQIATAHMKVSNGPMMEQD